MRDEWDVDGVQRATAGANRSRVTPWLQWASSSIGFPAAKLSVGTCAHVAVPALRLSPMPVS